MRGRAAVPSLFLVLLLSSTAAPRASAQCSWTPRLSIPFRATALDVSIDGPYLWVATGYGVQLLQNEGTSVAGSVALPGATRVVRSDGRGNGYVGSGSRVYVLRGGPSGISVVRQVEAGANVNDMLLAGSYLFVATANGIAHFDVLEPANPVRTSAALPTSSPNVTSLAVAGSKLYAADGDSSLEVFSITIPAVPQHTSELATVARATAVHAAPDGTLYVSDAVGLNTDVFAPGGTTAMARIGAGTNSFAAGSNGVHFTAAPERTIRAIDFNSTAPVIERLELQLLPTGGTDNVIHAMARAGNRLYVAAGDIGLAVLDLSSLSAPYPLVAYRSGARTSAVISDDRAWFADSAGNITEQKIDAAGIALSTERTWGGGTLVHEVQGSSLLASNGVKATLWSLLPSTPSVAAETTFPAAIKSAAMSNGTIVALLADGTVWAGSQQVTLPRIAYMAAGGGNIILAELTREGETILHRYGSQQKLTVSGTAIGGIAVSSSEAALFTFAGINVVNLASGATRVLPESHRVLPQQLAFAGEHVLLLARRALYAFGQNGLVREQALPADAVILAARSGVAVLATNEGTLATNYLAAQPVPSLAFANTFYTKLAASRDRTYLLAGDTIDVFSDNVHFEKNVRVPGIVDLAASNDALFTLTATGIVAAYSKYGVASAQITLDEGSDAQMLAIDAVGGAVWVSLSRGCLTTGCQQKTLVLDPTSLAVTATMTGAVTDVVVS
ncbi:MAG TPA: hypothetical protein VND45_03620, partial [Thermoanaerobaculia bacterium]|nr:hypothetical protein [Thermoanaerobaculia bacterium]